MTKQEILEKFKDYPIFQIQVKSNKKTIKILKEIQKKCFQDYWEFDNISTYYEFDFVNKFINISGMAYTRTPELTHEKLLEIWESDSFIPEVGKEYEFSNHGINWTRQTFITKITNIYLTVDSIKSLSILIENRKCVACVPYTKIRKIPIKKFTKKQAIEIIAKSENIDKTKIEII